MRQIPIKTFSGKRRKTFNKKFDKKIKKIKPVTADVSKYQSKDQEGPL